MSTEPDSTGSKCSSLRLKTGAVIFVVGQLSPLTVPLVTLTSLSNSTKAALSALLLLGIPEFSILLAVVILGRTGFNELKARLFAFLKRTFVSRKVSRRRYYFGLSLFLVPIFVGWASPYLFGLFPDAVQYRLLIAITGDVTLVLGLCLLGGEFWDKLRALVVYETKVAHPCPQSHGADSACTDLSRPDENHSPTRRTEIRQ